MRDLIERQEAIDALWKLDVEIRPSAINAIIDMIRTLSPAETPKRTGKSAQNVPNDDLISRKAAIEAVDATWWNARGIRKTIQELPSAQQWIPCNERLPKPNRHNELNVDVYYLAQTEYGDMIVASYNESHEGKAWWEQMYTSLAFEEEIVAWMHLPEPYKEGEA